MTFAMMDRVKVMTDSGAFSGEKGTVVKVPDAEDTDMLCVRMDKDEMPVWFHTEELEMVPIPPATWLDEQISRRPRVLIEPDDSSE